MPGLYVYSNDGKTQLWYTEGPINSGQYFEVVSTGLRTVTVIENEENITQLYTYEGGNTFLGFANTANSDEVVYGIGSKVPYGKEIYVVEGPAQVITYEHILLNGNKVQADSAIRDGNGVRIDTNYAKKADLATVATSGSYNDLKNKPNIPAIPSITVTDSQSGNAVTDVTASGHKITLSRGKTFSEVGHTHSIANVTGLQSSLDGKLDDSTKYAGSGSVGGGATKLNVNDVSNTSPQYLLMSTGTGDQSIYRAKFATVTVTQPTQNQLWYTVSNMTVASATSATTSGACSGNSATATNAASTATTVANMQLRNIKISTSDPTSSDGANGDIWIVYEA